MAMFPLNASSLNGVRDRARSVLAGFTLGQRAIVLIAGVALVAGVMAVMHYESRPNYQPLFTNLQASDSGAITAQLTTNHVPYQLQDGGSTVLVPANDVDQERVALAEQGLPGSGTVGFSTLEKSGITTSEFVQQVEYQQALEGQLAQVIESISGVQSAQVSLVVPQQSAFAVGTGTQATTASILVDLAPGAHLSTSQVSAIEHLAASATPGLKTSNVTVVDNAGDVLSAASTTGTTGSSDAAATTNYDNQLAGSIQALLDRVVGVGNAAVQVHARLDFDQQSTTTSGVQVGTNGKPIEAPTSTTTTNETYTGTGAAPSGLLGAGSTSSTGNGTYKSTTSDVTNAVGQVTQTIKQAPGQVESTSVAVLLNSSVKPAINAKNVTALVTAAAGLNLKNGDQLVVTSMPFAKAATPAALPAASKMATYEKGATVLGMLLLIFALLFFALRAARKPVYSEVALAEYGTPALGASVDGELGLPTPALRGPAPLELPGESFVPPEAVYAQVRSYIEQRPSEIARLLRAWADEQSEEFA